MLDTLHLLNFYFLLLLAVTGCSSAQNKPNENTESQALALVRSSTGKPYFTYRGKPLLSFGGGAGDGMFWLNQDAFDYVKWADWEAIYGMNHSRDYPPLNWRGIEMATAENGGDTMLCVFPYEETTPGSREFDLSRFSRDGTKVIFDSTHEPGLGRQVYMIDISSLIKQ